MENTLAEFLAAYKWKFAIGQVVGIKRGNRCAGEFFVIQGRELRQMFDGFTETYTTRREDGAVATFNVLEIDIHEVLGS